MIDPRRNFKVESPPQHAQNEKSEKKRRDGLDVSGIWGTLSLSSIQRKEMLARDCSTACSAALDCENRLRELSLREGVKIRRVTVSADTRRNGAIAAQSRGATQMSCSARVRLN